MSLEERIRIIEDREEISRMRVKYTLFNDGGWNGMPTHHDIDGLMEMFAPDAIWDGSPYTPRAEGHDNIRQLMIDFQATPFVIHNVMNPIIDVDGDTATGNWHAIIVASHGGEALWVFGNYEEEYVRLDGRWKFKNVRFVTAVQAPYKEGWGKLVAQG
jgi:ketosteroid isomerase-like protein